MVHIDQQHFWPVMIPGQSSRKIKCKRGLSYPALKVNDAYALGHDSSYVLGLKLLAESFWFRRFATRAHVECEAHSLRVGPVARVKVGKLDVGGDLWYHPVRSALSVGRRFFSAAATEPPSRHAWNIIPPPLTPLPDRKPFLENLIDDNPVAPDGGGNIGPQIFAIGVEVKHI